MERVLSVPHLNFKLETYPLKTTTQNRNTKVNDMRLDTYQDERSAKVGAESESQGCVEGHDAYQAASREEGNQGGDADPYVQEGGRLTGHVYVLRRVEGLDGAEVDLDHVKEYQDGIIKVCVCARFCLRILLCVSTSLLNDMMISLLYYHCFHHCLTLLLSSLPQTLAFIIASNSCFHPCLTLLLPSLLQTLAFILAS